MQHTKNIDKLAGELISEMEQKLGRELATFEKVAVIGAAARLGLGALKTIKPTLPKNIVNRAQNWGKAISTSYKRSKAQNLSTYDTARRILGGAMKQDPVLTTGTLMGGGYGLGKLTNRKKQQVIQGMPVYAGQKIDSLEKEATNKEESKGINPAVIYGAGGATAGLLLSIRNKRVAQKLKEKELLNNTQNLRKAGDEIAKKYKDFSAQREEQFKELFKDIPDPFQRKKVADLTKDIDKLINETSKTVPHGVNRSDISKEFSSLIDKAYDAGEIPVAAREHLRRLINNKFQ